MTYIELGMAEEQIFELKTEGTSQGDVVVSTTITLKPQ